MKSNVGATDIFYVYIDQIGAPRAITTNASTPVTIWSCSIEPNAATRDNNDLLGANITNSENDGDSENFTYNVRLPGQYFDLESGMHYNYFMDYDSGVGKYMTSDPIGLKGGLNTFGYVGGEPNRFIDPNGLSCVSSNGNTNCITPAGLITFPTPVGWPSKLDTRSPNYHFYNIPVRLNGAPPDCALNGLNNNPTLVRRLLQAQVAL